MKEQPVDTIPKDRKILVKHEEYGWIEAGFWDHDRWGNAAWDNNGLDRFLYLEEITAWAELPENKDES